MLFSTYPKCERLHWGSQQRYGGIQESTGREQNCAVIAFGVNRILPRFYDFVQVCLLVAFSCISVSAHLLISAKLLIQLTLFMEGEFCFLEEGVLCTLVLFLCVLLNSLTSLKEVSFSLLCAAVSTLYSDPDRFQLQHAALLSLSDLASQRCWLRGRPGKPWTLRAEAEEWRSGQAQRGEP